jgi:hypothetical protein
MDLVSFPFAYESSGFSKKAVGKFYHKKKTWLQFFATMSSFRLLGLFQWPQRSLRKRDRDRRGAKRSAGRNPRRSPVQGWQPLESP